MLRGVRQQQDEPGRFSICSRQAAVVRIVAQRGYGSGLTASLDVYVLRRDSSESNWSLCGKDPHPEWRKMSVDEYQKFGRSEMLRYATPGEILRVASAIGQPMSFLDGNPAF
ncbi:hypothetical protein [Escherichia coli]